MDASALIPLIATIAYIPLFAILISNRPWQRRHKLFLLFLIPAVLWSFSTFLSRSNLLTLTTDKRLDVGIVICLYLWMLVQFHYFIRSFYRPERVKIPLAYVFVMLSTVLVALAINVPGSDPYIYSVGSENGGVVVHYNGLIIALVLGFLLTVGLKDITSLLRRRKISPDPEEVNQIAYLLVAIAVLAVFISVTTTPWGQEFPVSHIGNLIVACVLTYAVVTYRLLDMRVIIRQAAIYVVLYGGGIGLVVLFFWLAQRFAGFKPDTASLAAAIGLGIPFVLLVVHRVRAMWQRKVEQAFIGARYSYRRQLAKFIDKIQDVPTLEDLGREFISLLAKSLDCRRACLLVPEAESGWFSARFVHPPVEDSPMKDLKLKWDSPVVTWLEREKRILPERNLAILPEFQSIWNDEREETQLAGVEIFVPLMNNGRLVAVLAVSERADGRPYAVEDIDLLEFVTAQVAASMESRYSDEQLREQDAQTSLVNRLTGIITSSTSIQMIFEAFAQELKKVVDIDWATIALIDGTELYFLALSSTIGSAWQPEERIQLEGTGTELACRERRAVYEPDLKRQHRFWTSESHLKQGISSIVSLPLSVTGRVIGALILASRMPNAYSRSQIRLLEKVALQIAAPIENAQLYAQAEQKSRIDELTGLFNRRHFEERLKEEIARHSRYGDPFSLFMLDLDNFKTYNDVYGHPAGDTLLGQIGTIIKNCVRDADQAFRYGGDEFVVILPQTARDDAHVVAERVRREIADDMEMRSLTVTCSIGLASYPADGVMAGELVAGADAALYYAKWTGGNRTYSSSKAASEQPDDARVHGKRDGLSAVYALVSVVEARDPYVYGHSRKVNTYAVALAEAIGLSPDEVSRVSTAALLHDIGKIGIPDEVLNKKAKLSAENWEAIRAHPRLGTNIVSNIPQLVRCADSILHHHERWDGSGYPEGLKGDQIPLESRILAIADSFEAMSSARPYRPALSREEVLEELRKGAGTQFDPNLVQIFIGIIEAGLPEKVKTGKTGHPNEPGSS
jgi:diguanylate cyclase (GGDEF)-like protein/putative nucleotidyltransferase with HDIG domain